jgi:transaldolase/glucose-6-phosphate isomerase
MHRLGALAEQGQSIWLDYIRRGMTRSGELARLVGEDGVRGVTSNPTIFQGSIAGSRDYDDVLAELVSDPSFDAKALYEQIAITDIQEACAALRPVYDATAGADGFVSFEVSPGLARDTAGTIAEAVRYWRAVAKPNLMIKVPGTPEGIVAVEALIAQGINVNVTLIFACAAYERIAQAYIRGLQTRATRGERVDGVASVASFFVSRIDTEVDDRLARIGGARADALRGKIAVANAKVAYQIYEKLLASRQWQALAKGGARPQRLLWASTGTKNKAYSDVLYVDELIGRDTVNTVPPATLDAFRDHGTVAPTLTTDVEEARAQLADLEAVGVSLAEVTDLLLEQGLEKFAESMDGLLATVAALQRKAQGGRLDRTTHRLPRELGRAVEAALASWDHRGNTQRLWNRDASLWTSGEEARWLGWLDVVERIREEVPALETFARELDVSHVLLLGMGGSSLCPDVLSRTYGARTKGPKLTILDSTVPAQVERIAASIDPKRTLFVVASKSGSTLEPTVFMEYFLAQAGPERFVAITDPGSKLEAFAVERGFRRVFHGEPAIGGRFSALSAFGMVPAAVMGLDVGAFLGEAARMVEACRPGVSAQDNPGVSLGVLLGTAANAGLDKLTFVLSPAIRSFGGWLEQLVAESTGKHGKAIIPVDDEPLSGPHGDDRLYVYLRLRSTPDASQDAAVAALENEGEPVVRIELDDVDALPQEFYRWQVATAVAGSIMGIDPFDQPDVEASKVATRRMTAAFEATGSLPPETPIFSDQGVTLFTDEANAQALGRQSTLAGFLRAHLGRIEEGDYFALLAYVDMNELDHRALQRMRLTVRDAKAVATCLGFGPRFLHSTGQAYKGGPNTGVFLQVTCDAARTVPVPGRALDFETIAAAQARGDFEVLIERGRRALRVHLGAGVEQGLRTLEAAVTEAVGGR